MTREYGHFDIKIQIAANQQRVVRSVPVVFFWWSPDLRHELKQSMKE